MREKNCALDNRQLMLAEYRVVCDGLKDKDRCPFWRKR